MKHFTTAAVLCIVTATAGCRKTEAPPVDVLNGKGSTFVSPLMVQWSNAFEKTENGCRINYEGHGSGSGIKAVIANTADFGCADGPLTDEQLAKVRQSGDEVVHIPVILGAVVPVYNLAEVEGPLRFSGPLLADIYLGKVKKWNDQRLKDLNPKAGAQLPDKEITVVHRSDGSGTTYIWVDYLAKVSPEWKDKVGVGTEVPWPTGVAEPGNDGVAKRVKEAVGSIGYVELSYAHGLDLQTGLVQNREKEFIKAQPESVKAAVDNGGKDIPDDLRFSLTDPPGKGSYPVCGTTWVIVRLHQPRGKGEKLVDFLSWVTNEGQEYANELLYLRLPDPLLQRAREKIKEIQVGKQ